MPDQTPLRGYTVTEQDGSDPIQEWPGIIYQLGHDIEAADFLAVDAHPAGDQSSTYPPGVTLMRLTTAGATGGAWPAPGTVLTHRIAGGGQTHQMLFVLGTNAAVYWRGASSGDWSRWYSLGGAAAPAATDSNTYTFDNVAGPTSATIAFPAGRFTAAPVVTATTHDRDAVVSVTGKTASGFTLLLGANGDRPIPSGCTVEWIAMQSY